MTTPPQQLPSIFTHAFPHVRPAIITCGPGGSVWVAAAPNASPIVTLVVPELDAHLAFRLSQPGQAACRHDVIGLPLPPWGLYVGAIGLAWAARGHAVPGLDAVIHTEHGVQEGFVWETGLAFAAAWQDLGGWPQPEGGLLGLLMRLGPYFREA